jgi:hypothetical protein
MPLLWPRNYLRRRRESIGKWGSVPWFHEEGPGPARQINFISSVYYIVDIDKTEGIGTPYVVVYNKKKHVLKDDFTML